MRIKVAWMLIKHRVGIIITPIYIGYYQAGICEPLWMKVYIFGIRIAKIQQHKGGGA